MIYDKKVDALYIEFKEIKDGTASVREISDSVSINYDKEGKIAGIEILEASKQLENITKSNIIEDNYQIKELIFDL